VRKPRKNNFTFLLPYNTMAMRHADAGIDMHSPSAEERDRIQEETGESSGDVQDHSGHAHPNEE
jgi:hypothetical protein